jgi:hypothetical protein
MKPEKDVLLKVLADLSPEGGEVPYEEVFDRLNVGWDSSMEPVTYGDLDAALNEAGFGKVRARSGAHRDKVVVMGFLHTGGTAEAAAENTGSARDTPPEESSSVEPGDVGLLRVDEVREIIEAEQARGWVVVLVEGIQSEAGKLGITPYDVEQVLKAFVGEGELEEVFDGIYRPRRG